jgi:hypothetical protein
MATGQPCSVPASHGFGSCQAGPRYLFWRLPPFERGQPEFELVDAVPEDLKLGLVGQPSFCSSPQPG